MDLYTIILYFFAVVTLGSACIVVFSRNIVRAAFALLFAFFGVAGIYIFLLADFIAITQLLIYVGGIMVLMLFSVMLTSHQINVDAKTGTIQTLPAILIAACVGGGVIWVFWITDWKEKSDLPVIDTTAAKIGELLLTNYLLPFEIASVVLLVALVGAAMIARREKKG
ncbi:MAG: NADH-quinone oxidoreductase subunit J [Ignavibacteriae bacterium]|nr:MAG: NADH-quinone oxidoreductase subunit J [Ignavibacteriota bacterium]